MKESKILKTAGILMIISTVLEVIAGIWGLKSWNRQEKSGRCVVKGVVLILFSVVSGVGSIVISGFTVNTAVSLLLGLIPPVLYIYGASSLKNV